MAAASAAQAQSSAIAQQFGGEKRKVVDRSWEDVRDTALSAASAAQTQASKIAGQFGRRGWQDDVAAALAVASAAANGQG